MLTGYKKKHMPGQKSEGFVVDVPKVWYNRKEARSYESKTQTEVQKQELTWHRKAGEETKVSKATHLEEFGSEDSGRQK